MKDHFEVSQDTERQNIKLLFENYFKIRNCSNLILTSTTDYSSFDALFISALTTTCICEYKRRKIDLFKYTDCLIEWPKWKALREYHTAGNVCFYIIEYDNFTAIFNLSTFFDIEQYPNNPTHFFYWMPCTSTSDPDKYKYGEKEKLVRGLEFQRANFYLDKNFNRLSYQEVNETYTK